MKRHAILVRLALALAMFFAAGFQQPTEHRTDVPDHPWDLILVRPEASSVTASLMAYKDSEAYLEYGTTSGAYPAKTAVQPFAKGVPGTFLLGSLTANTRYYYRLRIRDAGTTDYAASDEYGFITQRPRGATFRFTMQADSHLDENTDPAIYAQALANMRADGPDFLVDLGDTFMTDKYTAYMDAGKQYLAQRYYFGLLCPTAPLLLTLGNHDGEQGRFLNGTSDNMTVWSNTLRKKLFPNPVPDTFYSGNGTPDPIAGTLENYFAWEWGDALFVVLDPFWNTNRTSQPDNWAWTLGAPQYQWLKRTLEASAAKYKFVFLHHLVGGADTSQRGGSEAAKFYEWGGYSSSGSYDFPQKRPGWEMPIHQLLVKNKVSAVFHGHDHLYVKQDLDGIVYMEVPQPGFPRFNQSTSATDYGYLSGVILGSPGHLRVTVAPDKARVELVRPVLAKDETATKKNGQVDHAFDILPAAPPATSVSAASYKGAALAPESIAAVFGTNLAASAQIAAGTPLPTALGGASVKVKDAAGTERAASLFFVSPGQINFQVPPGSATGAATVTVANNGAAAGSGSLALAAVAPGLFTADASGTGYPAAVVLRYRGNDLIATEPVVEFNVAQNQFVPKPIDLGPETDTLFLVLFGTGFRNRSALGNVLITLGGTNAQVLFAGAQGSLVGLDQLNVRIPASLRSASGDVALALTVDGVAANSVKLNFRSGAR